MSYILDALKRADAERERGQVPGLHAQSIESAPASGRGNGLPRWALAAGGGTALVVVAALAWRMGADAHAPLPAPLNAPDATPAVAAAPAPAQTAAPAPAPVLAPAPGPEPTAAAPAIAPAPLPTPTVAPAPPPVAYVAPPPRAPKPVREAKPAAPRPAPPVPAPAVAPATEAAATAPIPLLAELPGSLRQQLPKLMVTGSVYSEDAGSRFVMLNGDVVKEGGQPAPGLVLERIEPKSAVLRFKGQRFRLPY
ncbi:general secretion pathway protein GspB [Ideonella sp.]|uniref:general secretion pathway protein GspB n=1 Tax=Ideonella sp. TaxID=1929293 RepID=UPI0035B22901